MEDKDQGTGKHILRAADGKKSLHAATEECNLIIATHINYSVIIKEKDEVEPGCLVIPRLRILRNQPEE